MKPSTAKAKGRETENSFVQWMWDRWNRVVERRRLTGAQDKGDISGWPDVCVEVKSGAKVSIAKWLSELEDEMKNSESRYGFVAVRPPGNPHPDGWYAVMPLDLAVANQIELEEAKASVDALLNSLNG